MVTTSEASLADRLRLLRNHGSRRTGGLMSEFIEPGFNYRLGEIPAALGLSQMRRIDQILLDRRKTAGRYDQALADVQGVGVPLAGPDSSWSYQSYVVVLEDAISRDSVITGMAAAGLETTAGTYACHQHPAYSGWGYRPGDLPNSNRFANQTLTLPLIPRMSLSQVNRVVETLASLLGSL